MSRRRWERVQRIEQAYHEQKDPRSVRDFNLLYWSRILDALPPGVRIEEHSRVLDVGCGGAGILLALDRGVRTGADPLMGFYLQKFPFLRETPIRWVEGTAEQLDAGEPFHVIFSINMLDHTIDPRAAARNIERLLAPGGALVLLLNVHFHRAWRLYYSLFYRFVDPPHPHHIHIEDVPGLFPALRLEARQDADSLWLDLAERYKREVCHLEEESPAPALRKLLNPFLYPVAAARILFHRPFHRKRPGDRPIMASTLFAFRRPA